MTPESLVRIFWRSTVRRGRIGTATLALGMACAAEAQPSPAPLPPTAGTSWNEHLVAEFASIESQTRGRLGVYVRDLDTGQQTAYRADQRWYLASMIKVPVAMAVFRGVERGHFTLETPVTLRAGDYVDGAGPTKNIAVGTLVTVRFLLEQMIIRSDNTATDVLIDLVGLADVNALNETLVPGGFTPITTLSDIRRTLYGYLTPEATKLTGRDLILLQRERVDVQRLQLLARLTGTRVADFKLPSLDAAYRAYYATGVNSGSLSAYGRLLEQLANGQALTSTSTAVLLQIMARVETGNNRLKAGFPSGLRFSHKTGTQRARICDAGLLRVAEAGDHERRAVVVACVRGEPSLQRSEAALMQVGLALCRSGLITQGIPNATTCPAHTRTHPVPAVAADDSER
ncbi:serine hydrolase [Variovorax ginsengisoli]|uniref:beta-lactamase n=1 Tax=Variovorax ginsengisoli TaxID=363844 RepID=A0ABT9S0E7_9BURK|nr:serine hydrolase [Variovorax ginsengisoli]MDP9897823.1 beta-lactamase class A [Variovorax ginsengisoli]